MPGTDVDWLLNRILPALDAGVLIHVHDVFLPDPYPAGWAWRGYNEQQALAALLQGGGYAIRFASHYVADAAARSWRTACSAACPAARRGSPAASGSRSRARAAVAQGGRRRQPAGRRAVMTRAPGRAA